MTLNENRATLEVHFAECVTWHRTLGPRANMEGELRTLPCGVPGFSATILDPSELTGENCWDKWDSTTIEHYSHLAQVCRLDAWRQRTRCGVEGDRRRPLTIDRASYRHGAECAMIYFSSSSQAPSADKRQAPLPITPGADTTSGALRLNFLAHARPSGSGQQTS